MPFVKRTVSGEILETRLMYKGKSTLENKKPPEIREVSEIEFAVDVLGSFVNVAMRNGCTFSEVLKIYEVGGEKHQLHAEKAVMKSIQTLIREITLLEDNVQVDPNMLKQLLQWKIEL